MVSTTIDARAWELEEARADTPVRKSSCLELFYSMGGLFHTSDYEFLGKPQDSISDKIISETSSNKSTFSIFCKIYPIKNSAYYHFTDCNFRIFSVFLLILSAPFLSNIALSLIDPIPLYAQIGGRIGLGTSYDNNPYLDTVPQPSAVIVPSMSIYYSPEELPIYTSANFQYARFMEYPNRDYYSGSISITTFIELTDGLALNIGGIGYLRAFAEDLQFFDHQQLMGMIGIEQGNEASSFSTFYTARNRTYHNLEEISYLEHKLGPGLFYNINSLSTFSVDLDILAKIFTNRYSDTEHSTARGNHNGKGKMNRKVSGNAMQPGVINTQNNAYRASLAMTYSLSLSSDLGLGASLIINQPLDSDNASILAGTSDIVADPELFDDPYSYNEISPNMILSLIQAPYLLSLQLQFSHRKFLYSAVDINDDFTSDQRQDNRIIASVSTKRELQMSESLSILLLLEYIYFRNISNAPIYDLTNHTIRLSTSLAF